MAPKLSEMDDVVKMIHMNSILNQKNDQGRTLLVRRSLIWFFSLTVDSYLCLMNSLLLIMEFHLRSNNWPAFYPLDFEKCVKKQIMED